MPEATGRPGYHPSVFLKLYVYGYLTRVQSSRRLEREAGCSVEVMWLTGRLVPDHKTVADYRKDNGSAIRKVGSRGAEGLGGLGRPHLGEERAHDGAGDLVLDLKEVHQIALVALGPDIPGGGGVDDGARILLVISGEAAILATCKIWVALQSGGDQALAKRDGLDVRGRTAMRFGRLCQDWVPVDQYHRTIVVAALLVGTGMCASSDAATLGEELAILLATHPRIAAAEHSVTAAEDRVDLAFSGFLPTVRITGDAGYEETDSPARRSAQAESFRAGRATSSISLTENIFDGFRSVSDLNSAKFDKRSIEHRLREERQNRVFEGTSAYLEVNRQTDLIEVARENEQTIMIQLNLEDERVRRGSGIEVDVLLAKSRLQLAKEQRVAFEGQLQDAISRYIQVFGHAPDISTMEIPELPLELQPSTFEDALAVARTENPTIAASSKQIEVARQRRQSAKANFYPRLDFVVRGNWEDDANGIEGPRRDAAVLLQFNWELFSGFATNAEVAQASSQLSAITSNHAFVNRAIAEQVRLAWEGLNTAGRRRDLLENAILIADEVFRTRGRLRDSGKETAINVLDAEREVNNARINFIAAEYNVHLAFYRLLLALGRLTGENLGVKAPPQQLQAPGSN